MRAQVAGAPCAFIVPGVDLANHCFAPNTTYGVSPDGQHFQLSWDTSVGSMVQGSGSRVHRSGSKVQGLGFRVQGPGCRVPGLWFRFWGCGFKVWILSNSGYERVRVHDCTVPGVVDPTAAPRTPHPAPRTLHLRVRLVSPPCQPVRCCRLDRCSDSALHLFCCARAAPTLTRHLESPKASSLKPNA